ncbi:hypothetical protein EB796_005860 [Bugula neritina]|uniref:Uncharacterized protein n=1 Tax=Bugula neritina TaxID=10212 RepID=A0A7J7KB05_BUGNE|nr:hypothetical protein EB796_005860 [Bugula neritina]
MLKFPQPAVLKKDSGFAWLVLSMTAISCFAHYGFANSVTGGLTIVQKDYFNIDLQLSSLIGSAYIACMHIFGKYL